MTAKPVRMQDGAFGILVDAREVQTLRRLSEAYTLLAEILRGPDGAALIEDLRSTLGCRRAAKREEIVDQAAHALATGRIRVVDVREAPQTLSEPDALELADFGEGETTSAPKEDEWVEFAFVDEDGELIEELRYELEPADAERIDATSSKTWPIRYDDLGTKFTLHLVEVPEKEEDEDDDASGTP